MVPPEKYYARCIFDNCKNNIFIICKVETTTYTKFCYASLLISQLQRLSLPRLLNSCEEKMIVLTSSLPTNCSKKNCPLPCSYKKNKLSETTRTQLAAFSMTSEFGRRYENFAEKQLLFIRVCVQPIILFSRRSIVFVRSGQDRRLSLGDSLWGIYMILCFENYDGKYLWYCVNIFFFRLLCDSYYHRNNYHHFIIIFIHLCPWLS